MTRSEILRIASIQARAELAYLRAIDIAKTGARIKRLERAIMKGDIQALMQELSFNEVRFAAFVQVLRENYSLLGAEAIKKVKFPSGAKVDIKFDGTNPRAEAFVQKNSAKLVKEIIEDQITGIRSFVEAGIRAGNNPRQTALDLVGRIDRLTKRRTGGIVGLNSQQIEWVQNAREDLSDPAKMGRYLDRAARDKRFDGIVKRARAEGKPLAQADITRILERYEDKLLKYRGETIARTETLEGYSASAQEGIEQIVEDGITREEFVERIWQSAGRDGKTRDTHLSMDGQATGMKEPFRSPEGYYLMYPCDSSLGAPGSETINCRCDMEIRVNHLLQGASEEWAELGAGG